MSVRNRFRRVVLVDFEFSAPSGEIPKPICVVFREIGQPVSYRYWLDRQTAEAPSYSIEPSTLIVAYYASAEIGCHISLGWPSPSNVLDLYAEFRCLTNGRETPCGSGLLGAAAYFGLDTMSAVEKDSMRDLAIRGGPFTTSERRALLDYCEQDVKVLERLFTAMLDRIDLDRALLRGRYMSAVARMEATGVPIDTDLLSRLKENWDHIRGEMIARVDENYGVFEQGHFRSERWTQWLARYGIPWPLSESGRPLLSDDTFKEMSLAYPSVRPVREIRRLLAEARPLNLAVGRDGRNRCLLSPFRSKTGRNQPSNARSIFGAPAWMRGLVRPRVGQALAYIDWSQQEFGIAAALSEDSAMMEAYRSDDPYLAFARQAGATPSNASKESHADVREQFKACVLGVQYGMTDVTLGRRLAQPTSYARQLLDLHRRTYPRFWGWSQAAMDTAMLTGRLTTVYGWPIHVGPTTRWRTLANFPMQANGAEMLRVACILATEDGVRVCAPVHDALLIEAPEAEIHDAVQRTRTAMARASRAVLSGFELRTDVRVIRYPDRLIEARGQAMWDRLVSAVASVRQASLPDSSCCTGAPKMVHA